jgi:hypothetical protein
LKVFTRAIYILGRALVAALLDDIRSKIEVAQSVALPSSALSKACQYSSLAPHMGETQFVQWKITSKDIPPNGNKQKHE